MGVVHRRVAVRAGALALAVAAGCLLAACGPARAPAPSPGTTTVDLDGRPFRLHVPPGHDAGTAVPLLVGLHGYTSRSTELDDYFGLTAASDDRGFLLALPDGLANPRGDQYWNAVPGGCCDFYDSGVDDSEYLSRLVDAVRSSYAVSEVAVLGHSNGGYMAHRFACDHADQVDAIASLAGPLPDDNARCRPSEPVRVLHLHGDADDTVPYAGSAAQSSASAAQTAARWAELDGCSLVPDDGPALDLDTRLPGAETTVVRYDGCAPGGGVQLWTIAGGGHVPTWTDVATPAILDALLG